MLCVTSWSNDVRERGWGTVGGEEGGGEHARGCKALGSGKRYQILSHVFARCASQTTHGHARITRVLRAILAWPCVV